jgi:transcriptional regulator with XRE-family HTH domain
LNVSQKQISRIEKGSVSPSFDFLNAICLALHINLKTLLNFDEEIIFNNNNHNQAGGEFIAYNNTEIHKVEKLYERLLLEKDKEIERLKNLLS